MEGGLRSRTSSGYHKDKFREAMAMACSFLQVEEIYPDQEKALRAFLMEVIFSLARTLDMENHLCFKPFQSWQMF